MRNREARREFLSKLINNRVKVFYARGIHANFAMFQVIGEIAAKLGGPPYALAVKQGENGGSVAMRDLALLPFLDGPSGFTNIINGVAKFAEYPRIDISGADGLVQTVQFSGGFPELEGQAPKNLTGEEQFDGDACNGAVFCSSNGSGASMRLLARK